MYVSLISPSTSVGKLYVSDSFQVYNMHHLHSDYQLGRIQPIRHKRLSLDRNWSSNMLNVGVLKLTSDLELMS